MHLFTIMFIKRNKNNCDIMLNGKQESAYIKVNIHKMHKVYIYI